MLEKYRPYEDRCEIVRAVIAEDTEALSRLRVTDDEINFYRTKTVRAVHKVAKQAANYTEYYRLPTARPFAYVSLTSSLVIALAIVAFIWVYRTKHDTPAYPIYSALLTIGGVALGWWVIGRMTHRNTVRQNTNTMVFARFSHAPFNEALNRFHEAFEDDPKAFVTQARFREMRRSGDKEAFAATTSALYLLNYLEFVATGVVNGDFDEKMIRELLRGFLCYYYDKCEPLIRATRSGNPRFFQNLTKLRLAYRDA